MKLSPVRMEVIGRAFLPEEVTEAFSVCVTVKNEAGSIERFLASLVGQTRPADEIVIVDGGSTDGTVETIQALGRSEIRLIVEDGASPARGRNIASRSATHALQVTLDAGCYYATDFFVNLVGVMTHEDPPDIASGVYGAVTETRWSRYFVPDWNNVGWLRRGFLPSCRCASFRRVLFDKVGGFPEHLQQRWGEDTYFMLKAQAVSERWTINRKAMVRWNAPTTEEEAKRLAFRYGMGNGEIGFDCGYPALSHDPIMQSVIDGYRYGCTLRAGARFDTSVMEVI